MLKKWVLVWYTISYYLLLESAYVILPYYCHAVKSSRISLMGREGESALGILMIVCIAKK